MRQIGGVYCCKRKGFCNFVIETEITGSYLPYHAEIN